MQRGRSLGSVGGQAGVAAGGDMVASSQEKEYRVVKPGAGG